MGKKKTSKKGEKKTNMLTGTVSGLSRYGCYVTVEEAGEDYYIPEDDTMGALPGDTVMLIPTGMRKRNPEGRVKKILTEKKEFLGTVTSVTGQTGILPDFARGDAGWVMYPSRAGALKDGEIVSFCADRRTGTAEVLENHGMVDTSRKAVELLLDESDLPREFTLGILDEAREAVRSVDFEKELRMRKDLRELDIFTIDASYTKDMDDAIYAEKTDGGFRLLVSIADVSSFVREGGAMDEEAYDRGNSVYFGDSVIPMLPVELSNGACSLNEGEDKLTFTCDMLFDGEGGMRRYSFYKSVMRSRLKGVYSELNRIEDGKADAAVLTKYAPVMKVWETCRELYGLLRKRHDRRGGMSITSEEPVFTFDSRGRAVSVEPHPHFISEDLIEEFMLSANTAAAMFLCDRDLPGIYRVHDKPFGEKMIQLKDNLSRFGLYIDTTAGKSLQQVLSGMLDRTRGTDLEIPVHRLILRSQAKAKYSENETGHFGLVLDYYTHFTSPIRRYSDLAVHRIMTEALKQGEGAGLATRYNTFVQDRALQATIRENVGVNFERKADDIYTAEVMSSHLGEEFEGIITGVAVSGIFVSLPNTAEGMVRSNDLGIVDPVLKEGYSLSCSATRKQYVLGGKMKVRVAECDIRNGRITFVPA